MERNTKSVNLNAPLPKLDPDNQPIFTIINSKSKLSLFLVNGVKLSGKIVWCSSTHLILRDDRDQLVTLAHIATVCPESGVYFTDTTF